MMAALIAARISNWTLAHAALEAGSLCIQEPRGVSVQVTPAVDAQRHPAAGSADSHVTRG
jgi:hypothetical protein